MDTNNNTDDLGLEAGLEEMMACLIGNLTQKTEPDFEKAYTDVQSFLISIINLLDNQIVDGIENIKIKTIRDMISEVFITVHKNLRFNKDYQKNI